MGLRRQLLLVFLDETELLGDHALVVLFDGEATDGLFVAARADLARVELFGG